MKRHLPSPIAVILLAGLTVNVAPAAARGLATGYAPGQVVVKFAGERIGRAIAVPPQVDVPRAAAALRQSPKVAYAEPNYLATDSAGNAEPGFFVPDDPGTLEGVPGVPGGWTSKQWDFLPWEGPGTALLPSSAGGIDAPGAWQNLIEAGHPGAAGITVAVLDTGIAYRSEGNSFRRSPDFSAGQFVKGYDFVANNPAPLDRNGHGTQVAGTIAEQTDNGIGLTGLAYEAKLMPVRVLNRNGVGQAANIADGIRFAVSHGANVINMSFNFGCGKKVPEVDAALQDAYRNGVVAVASVGNSGSESCISEPATAPHVIGVGASTEGGCLADYSLTGKGVDLLAPGGGEPIAGCPSGLSRPIYQVTLKSGSTLHFGIPSDYFGTSMAAAHVSGAAAMILASGVLDPRATPGGRVTEVTRRLEMTARSLGLPAAQQGAGLIDVARATDPGLRNPTARERRELLDRSLGRIWLSGSE
jgi:serine protease